MSIVLTVAVVLALGQGGDAKPDPRAEAVVKRLGERVGAAKSVSGEVEVRMLGRTEVFEFKFLRPNFARFASNDTLLVQDGTKFYWYLKPENEYMEQPATKNGLPVGVAFNLGGIVGLEALAFGNEPPLVPERFSAEVYEGRDCAAIRFTSSANAEAKVTLFVDRKTGLPAGWKYEVGDYVSSGRYRKLVLDAPLRPSDFAWKQPPGAKLFKGDGS